MKRCICVCLITIAMLLPQTALAWNYTGHEVVARIAWEKMEPQTRLNIIALIMQAPPDAGLASLLPSDERPLIIRYRDLFLLASTWPDMVRSDEFPERKLKFHHSNWHYTNYFWKLENGVPVDVTELQPEPTNVVERLKFLRTDVINNNTALSQRGIDIAWITHLVGDVHQPLHTSARVTDTEPKGDQGGNLFLLTPADTPPRETKRLHGFWDDILSKSITRNANESDLAYANRIASIIMQRYPEAKLKDRLKHGDFVEWAREGLDSAKKSAYPTWLVRSRTPSTRYRKQTYATAESAVALAGYRLAALFDSLFSN